jgi:hypothetical protein
MFMLNLALVLLRLINPAAAEQEVLSGQAPCWVEVSGPILGLPPAIVVYTTMPDFCPFVPDVPTPASHNAAIVKPGQRRRQ